jgi:hypothetical protein
VTALTRPTLAGRGPRWLGRAAGPVDCECRGTWVYYWPVPDRLKWIATLLAVPDAAANV